MTSTSDQNAFDNQVPPALVTSAFLPADDAPEVARQAAETDDNLLVPGLWVTRPIYGPERKLETRIREFLYEADEVDPLGEEALYWGSQHYQEAMDAGEPEEHQTRIECFQTAEMLYLHAARRGSAAAFSNLGYVYSYNRCEGNSWAERVARIKAELGNPVDETYGSVLDCRAFECYLAAAQHGLAEACYKVGDLMQSGRGCPLDYVQAFQWYIKAQTTSTSDEYPSVLGSIALRLAKCYEEGLGCPVDFAKACTYYDQAVLALDTAVRMGDWYYRKQLRKAKDGLARAKQELSGQY